MEELMHPPMIISTVIASTAFSTVRILDVKKPIEELGGAARALAGEPIGITSVTEERFS
jgi:hypothetical protein